MMRFNKNIIFVIIALLVCSCNTNRQIKNIPEMAIEYEHNIEYVKPGAAKWSYSTILGIIHILQDSMHPLEYSNAVLKIEKTDKIKISILYAPDYYTARYWTENYIGDTETNEQYFQTIDVNNGIIIVPNEEAGKIFEVTAIWESVNGIKGIQGYAKYVFYVSNNSS